MKDLKPSHFLCKPFNSLLQNWELETVARNTMVIRSRFGDKWDLTWDEYKTGREQDNGEGCADSEKGLFDKVMAYLPDAIGAISFSQSWAEAAREA